MRTQDDVLLVFVYVLVEFLQAFRRRAQSGAGANAQFASVDQVEHTVLDNFGVNGQVFEIGVNQTIDNCVSYGAYAGLQRQQVLRQTASSNFSFEEVNQVFAHLLSVFVDSAQRTNFIGDVARNNSNDLFNFYRNIRSADDVFRSANGDRSTVRGIQRNIGVMHAFQCNRLSYVYFNDNFLSGLNIGRGVAHGGGRDQANFAFAQVDDFASFNDCNINVTAVSHEAITGHLSNMAQMQVSVFNLASIDSFTHIIVGLVRHTTVNDACLGHSGIHFRTYGCASPNVDFERSFFAFFSKSQRYSFRIARRGKTTGTYVVTIMYKFCSSFSAHNFASYYVNNAIFNVDHVYLPPYN